MFEIGFSEILLIFVIALVVLGPERLPKLAAQVGRWAGRAKSMARQFREQLESEVDLEAALTPKTKSSSTTYTHPVEPASTSYTPPVEPETPATGPTEAGMSSPQTPDDYSAAHDPASAAYATPAHEPLRDVSEEPPAVAPVPDPGAPAPPVQVDAFAAEQPVQR